MSNPADDFKSIFNGIGGAIAGIGNIMQKNDLMEKILVAWLVSNGYNMNGYGIRHFDRDGMLEFKVPTHSVQNGVAADTLYHISKAKLMQWAADNRPDLLSASEQTRPTRPIIRIQDK